MKIICDTCGAKYSIADEKVKGKVFKIRCKKCREIIVVRGTAGAEEASGGFDVGRDEAQGMGAGADFGGYDAATSPVWHVVLDGEQQGPYTAEQVAQFVAAGQLDFESYCWRDGFADWIHLKDIEELYRPAAAIGRSRPSQQPAYDENLSTAVAASAGSADPFGSYGEQPQQPQNAAAAYGAAVPSSAYGDPMGYQGFTAPASAQAAAQDAVSDLFGTGGVAAPAAQMGLAPPAVAGVGFAAPSQSDVAARGAAHDAGADLFAPTSDDGGGMFPAETAGDVMTSSPRVDVSRMTGTRNENSVLFSLSNLQALASGAQTTGSVSAVKPLAPHSVGHASGEGSGLIDIRSMAAAAAQDDGGRHGGIDDLLSIGGGGGFAPTLGAPVLLAQPPASSNKLIFALVGVAVAVVVGIGILLVVLLTGPDEEPIAVAQQPAVLAPQGLVPSIDPSAASASAQPSTAGIQTPSGPTPTPVETDEGGDTSTEAERAEARRAGGVRRGGGGGGGAAAAAPTSSPPPTSSSAPVSPSSSGGGGSSDLDRLLDGALGGGGGGGGGSSRTSGGGGGSSSAASASNGSDAALPQSLSRSQVQSGMNGVAGRVRRCGNGQSGTVMVNVVISGATGRVTGADVGGSFAGTPVGSCAARAVRSARFPRFRQSSLTVRYPFQVQ